MLASVLLLVQTHGMSEETILFPIQAWFVPREVPFGSAPDHIREQWVDVPLPLRQMRADRKPKTQIGHGLNSVLDVHIIDEAMEVYAFDAIKALTLFDRHDAATFWGRAVSPNRTLIFRGGEGQVYSTPVLQQILPGIELFDQTDL